MNQDIYILLTHKSEEIDWDLRDRENYLKGLKSSFYFLGQENLQLREKEKCNN